MLLACSPAHQLCQAVEAVETVEAVERCAFGAGDALRGAAGDHNTSRESTFSTGGCREAVERFGRRAAAIAECCSPARLPISRASL